MGARGFSVELFNDILMIDVQEFIFSLEIGSYRRINDAMRTLNDVIFRMFASVISDFSIELHVCSSSDGSRIESGSGSVTWARK